MTYNILNKFDAIDLELRDLFYSIYEDKFTIEIDTLIENLDAVNTKLIDEDTLNVSIIKQNDANNSRTYIHYNH